MSKMDIVDDFDQTSSGSDNNSSTRRREEEANAYIVEEDFNVQLQPSPALAPCESSGSLKRKTNRVLFSDPIKKKHHTSEPSTQALVTSFSNCRKLSISEIAYTRDRFAFEGKILNVYGTYDNNKDYKKYLKTDLTDEIGFSTITLVFGPQHYKKYLDKIIVDNCIRVEGANVVARTPSDGGSIDFSLHVDATTTIHVIQTFETSLFFVPELTIRSFLTKVAHNPSFKSTIAFVIVQVDSVQKSEGGVYEQLTIADGTNPLDRATLTFVSKRKSLYYQLVDQFQRGNIVPYLARNIGAWKERSNTLSVLDVTLVVPLYGDKKKLELEFAFNCQIKSLGYGKEVRGELRVTNFNGSLLVRKCYSCKSQNLNSLAEGAFCYPCGKKVAIEEVVKLVGEIEHENACVDVSMCGEAVDKVLRFEKPLLELYKEDGMQTRLRLAETRISGAFVLDPQGQIIGYNPLLVEDA